ncbi:MAG TPA: hypothetical protein VL463_30400 [Kofleriaceae bacterium]|nr:hypothetical protein [Kofleriaceae bacterium]
MLVRSGLIAAEHLAAARAVCAQVGGTLGEHLVGAGLITDDALTEFYRSRLLVPQVNPNSLARLSKEVVASVPADMAVEFRVVPVSMDREGNLTVAMSDPSNRHAVDEIAFFTGKYVVRAVATQMQIAWCLAHYYGHITELGTRLLRPAAGDGAAAPAPAPAAPKPIARPRGDTGRVDASRHRALAPITRPPINDSRPDPKMLDPNAQVALPAAPVAPPVASTKKPASVPPPIPAAALKQVAPPSIPIPAAVPAISPTATTLVPGQVSAQEVAAAIAERPARAPVATPPPPPPEKPIDKAAEKPIDKAAEKAPEPDEEVIEIADYPSGPVSMPPTQPTGPLGKGMQAPNPPELAARVGEMLVRDPTARIRMDEPAVVIAVDRLEQSAPVVVIDAEGERSQPAPVDDADEGATGPTLEVLARDEDGDEITDETPAVVHDRPIDPDSAPILLDRKRTIPDFAVPRDEETAPETPAAHARLSTHDRADTLDDDTTVQARPAPEAPGREDSDSDVVLLSQPKTRPRRTEKRTQLGIGALGAMVPRPAVAVDDATSPGIAVVLTAPSEIPSEGDRTIRVPVDYAPPDDDTQTSGPIVAGVPAGTSDPVADGVPRAFVDDDDDRKTHPVGVPAMMQKRPSKSGGEVDDGWGPPGTTIPPPFLGAVQGTEETNPSLKIPISSVDDEGSGPLMVKPATGPLADAAARAAEAAALGTGPTPAAPRMPTSAAPTGPTQPARTPVGKGSPSMPSVPSPKTQPSKTIATAIPPIPAASAPQPPTTGANTPAPPKRPTAPPSSTLLAAPPRPPTSPIATQGAKHPAPSPADLARDLEEAATKLLELLRELEKAATRDAAIELLVGHLAISHARVGFFAVKGGELQPLALRPKPPGPLPTLLLSRASTFQDVVGTRLPYRGPVVDDATRRLLSAAFASSPTEMLALPVAIKDRVVGIAYGDSRHRHTFDEQLAIAARATGQALERILKETKRAV